jgi:hypothetical protein
MVGIFDLDQLIWKIRRGGRAVECTGLENRQGFTTFVSSNLTLSANNGGFILATNRLEAQRATRRRGRAPIRTAMPPMSRVSPLPALDGSISGADTAELVHPLGRLTNIPFWNFKSEVVSVKSKGSFAVYVIPLIVTLSGMFTPKL